MTTSRVHHILPTAVYNTHAVEIANGRTRLETLSISPKLTCGITVRIMPKAPGHWHTRWT